jgi:hypothetical protein
VSALAASRFVRVGGILIFLSGLLHAGLGLPAVLEMIRQGLVKGEARLDVVVIWVYSSFAMVSLGLIVAVLASGLKRGSRLALRGCLIVAVAYLGFAAWALFYSSGNPHFIGFAVLGLLVGAPLVLARVHMSID